MTGHTHFVFWYHGQYHQLPAEYVNHEIKGPVCRPDLDAPACKACAHGYMPAKDAFVKLVNYARELLEVINYDPPPCPFCGKPVKTVCPCRDKRRRGKQIEEDGKKL